MRLASSTGSSLLSSPGLRRAEFGPLRKGIMEYTETEGLKKMTLQYQYTESTSSRKSTRVSDDDFKCKAYALLYRWVLSSFVQCLLSSIVETQEEHDA